MFILQNAMRVVNWVHQFDPGNVNNDDLKLPADLKQLNDHTKTLIKEFPKMNALNRLKKAQRSSSHHDINQDLMNSFSNYQLINPINQMTDAELMNLIES